MTSKIEKTNVMRILESKGIKYCCYEYDAEITDGCSVAQSMCQDEDIVFKTLVTVANDLEKYVFVIPVNTTLNIKKAAKAAGVKSIEMLKQKDLLPLTGYVHGGCSPIGMKKAFKTYINDTATLFDSIIFSAGKRGYQVEVSPYELAKLINANFADLT